MIYLLKILLDEFLPSKISDIPRTFFSNADTNNEKDTNCVWITKISDPLSVKFWNIIQRNDFIPIWFLSYVGHKKENLGMGKIQWKLIHEHRPQAHVSKCGIRRGSMEGYWYFGISCDEASYSLRDVTWTH